MSLALASKISRFLSLHSTVSKRCAFETQKRRHNPAPPPHLTSNMPSRSTQAPSSIVPFLVPKNILATRRGQQATRDIFTTYPKKQNRGAWRNQKHDCDNLVLTLEVQNLSRIVTKTNQLNKNANTCRRKPHLLFSLQP